MKNVKYIIVTEKPKLFPKNNDWLICTPRDFITRAHEFLSLKKLPKIINLANQYDYLSKGYYVSLMAEARSAHCVPDVGNIISLNWRRNYEFAFPEINALLEKTYTEPFGEPIKRTFTSFFGRHEDPRLDPVTRKLFDLFRFPVVSFEIKFSAQGKWVVEDIDTPSYNSLIDKQLPAFMDALSKFTGSAWKNPSKNRKQEKYWIAILHDPKEATSPSNAAALKKFISVGKKMGLWVELITKKDFSTLLEYDALFIRETTAINNHTYRFAKKAEQEGIPCIDDTDSIIRCCNKVFLKELLEANRIPVPKTIVLEKRSLSAMPGKLGFPLILKIPDGSFSKGMYKVSSAEDMKEKAELLFQKSDIILCQEFVPSAYDWRIAVLDNHPLFASKYYMAKGHWQIYNHSAKEKKHQSGMDESVPLDQVPEKVMSTALTAAKLIGRGFYGVDLKELEDGRVVVIEVNDNPNLDSGVEDKIAGDEVYRKILQRLIDMIEA